MKPIAVLASTAIACLLLAACNQEAAVPAAQTPDPQAQAAVPTEGAGQTEAVYGDEAPVAIQAEAPAEDDHAHNADGSHPASEEHAEEGDDHSHGADADHTH